MNKDLPGTVYFPGMEPIVRARMPAITRAPAQTVEGMEGMKDEKSPASYNKTPPSMVRPRIEAPAPQAPPEPIRAPAPEAQKPKVVQVPRKRNIQNRDIRGAAPDNIFFIKITAAILSGLAALMSGKYSFDWFKDKLPAGWNIILPVIIVGCATLAPVVALILFNRKGWKPKLSAVLVFCIGILASSFSMLSTIAGIYNANSEAINRKSTALISSQTDEDARQEVARIDSELSRLNAEIDATQAKVDSIAVSDTLKGDSQALMRRLNAAKKSKQDYETKRSTAKGVIEAARASGYTAETVREDFNGFMGRIFKTDSGKIEFGMAAAPALLLDVVAPILSAVALFL